MDHSGNAPARILMPPLPPQRPLTQVEQTTNLANASELSGAVQLIGHKVSYNSPSGVSATGKVESVQSSSSGTTVTVEGVGGITLSSITEVE